MEIKPTTVETTAKNVVETVEVEKISKSVVSATEGISNLSIPEPDTTTAVTNTESSESASLSSRIEILDQVKKLWEEYFGEGKKSNLVLAITIIATIPVLVAAASLLDFLNKLPILPSAFELIGFGYSAWFIYRYLLFAHTRKEITDAISNWKQKVFG